MKESALTGILRRLGIAVEARNAQPSLNKVWLNFRCPLAPFSERHKFREDRHPSAGAVADETGFASRWHCYTCKGHGTLYDLVRSLSIKDKNPAIDYEALGKEIIDVEASGLENIDWEEGTAAFQPLPEPLIEEAYEGLWDKIHEFPDAIAYMVKRGITMDTADRLGLMYDPDKKRILFEVRNAEGDLYGWSGRTIRKDGKPKVLDYEGLPKRHLVLGVHRWKKGKPIIIVEGLFAYAHFHQIRVESIANIGAILGSEMTKEKVDVILELREKVHLFVDPDEAGDICVLGPLKYPDDPDSFVRDLSRSAVHMLGKAVPTFAPIYPEDCDDPDDLTFSQVSDMLIGAPVPGFDGELGKQIK